MSINISLPIELVNAALLALGECKAKDVYDVINNIKTIAQPQVPVVSETETVQTMTTEQVAAIPSEQVPTMSTEAIAALSADQMAAMSTDQLLMINSDQLAVLSADQTVGLNPEQNAALTAAPTA